jgi:hypothetical protein
MLEHREGGVMKEAAFLKLRLAVECLNRLSSWDSLLVSLLE